MNAKKLIISIFIIGLILFGTISAVIYDKSASVDIICYEDSYAESYAKKHNIKCENISDSDAYVGMIGLENFDYNVDGGTGEIVAYNGDSEKIAIPKEIDGIRIAKVSEKAFENAKNLKSIYLPETIDVFEPRTLDDITVHMYKDTELYRSLSDDETVTYEINTIPESYYVNFYSSDIPFSYDNISAKTIKITEIHTYQKNIVIPESIDGKIVTSISFDALGNGVESILIPATVTSIEADLYRSRYDIDFFIGLLMALLGVCFASVIVLMLNTSSKEKMFLRVSQIKTAYRLAILSIILSALYMFVNIISDWIVCALFIVVCGTSAISIIKAKTTVALIEGVGGRIEEQTQFIKLLTADAEHLMVSSKNTELKAEAKKVYEAIRYSDPMSSSGLSDVEEQIQREFLSFAQAIRGADSELSKIIADNLINLIDNRNKMCKVLK